MVILRFFGLRLELRIIIIYCYHSLLLCPASETTGIFVHLDWSKMILIKELCSAQKKQVIGLQPESCNMTRRDGLSTNSPHPDLQQSK